ncbi:MAG: 3-ketoacyl-CoA thiolase @ Acetyl-CoA acetyltransferase, partial [uncultured Solirubrobacterales bacterium]
ARSRHRRCRPHPDRTRLQGLAHRDPPRRPRRLRRRPAARAQPRRPARGCRGPDLRLRPAPGRAELQHRSHHRPALAPPRHDHGHDGAPLLRIEPSGHPHRRPRGQGRRGAHLHRSRRRA